MFLESGKCFLESQNSIHLDKYTLYCFCVEGRQLSISMSTSLSSNPRCLYNSLIREKLPSLVWDTKDALLSCPMAVVEESLTWSNEEEELCTFEEFLGTKPRPANKELLLKLSLSCPQRVFSALWES